MTTKKPNIIPLADRVVIKPLVDEKSKKTASGIFIPDTVSKEKPEQGIVIAVGEGRTTDDGKVIPMKVNVGDTVLFAKYGPDEVKINGEEYYILSESGILAIIL